MSTTTRRRVILDTDTYNEVDDQFALAHLLYSPESIELEAVYAAPFFNDRCTGPADGMEKSYEEILRVIDHAGAGRPPVFRGSTSYLPDATTPVKSDAAADLVQRAMAMPDGEKLYVLGIAAPTNIASALLMEPKIAEKIVLVWLGGTAPYWPSAAEFNLEQDVHASRALFESGAPMVLVPCTPVTSHLITTTAELEVLLAPTGKLGRYLTDIVHDYSRKWNHPAWSKVIWDIAVSAWVINPAWFTVDTLPCPILHGGPALETLKWENKPDRRPIQIVRSLDRDGIFADFFAKSRKYGIEKAS